MTALPLLYAAYGTRVITLTSLTEATVYQCIPVGDEPESISKCMLIFSVKAEWISCFQPLNRAVVLTFLFRILYEKDTAKPVVSVFFVAEAN